MSSLTRIPRQPGCNFHAEAAGRGPSRPVRWRHAPLQPHNLLDSNRLAQSNGRCPSSAPIHDSGDQGAPHDRRWVEYVTRNVPVAQSPVAQIFQRAISMSDPPQPPPSSDDESRTIRLRLRTLARAVRHTPDRLLHAARRRAVCKAARGLGTCPRILVVCHGNICRSPYAAGRLRGLLSNHGIDQAHVTSAGFAIPNRRPPAHALTVAHRRGVDLSAHRSQLLTRDLVAEADFILVMDTRQRDAICKPFGRMRHEVALLGDFDPQPIDSRTIRDPVERPIAAFEESYTRIDRCVDELVRAVASTHNAGLATSR